MCTNATLCKQRTVVVKKTKEELGTNMLKNE